MLRTNVTHRWHYSIAQLPLQSRRLPDTLQTVGLILLSAVIACQETAAAQKPADQPVAEQTDDKPEDDLQRLYSERRIAQQLRQLSLAAGRNDANEVRELFMTLRAADPMLMVSDTNGTFVPLHRGLILRMLEFSAELQRSIPVDDSSATLALKRALESRHIDRLVEVLHRHAGTEASWNVHLLLAVVHADRGHRHGAQFWLAPLLNPQAPPRLKLAAETLQSKLLSGVAGDNLQAGVRKETAVSRNETSFPGSSIGSVPDTGSGSPEVAARWHLQWVDSLPLATSEKRFSQALVKGASDAGIIPWSAWEPVIDNAHAFIRTPNSISAFDLTSGEQLWTRAVGRRRGSTPDLDDSRIGPGISGSAIPENSAEITLLHRNELVGRMTSDSLRLFAVCTTQDLTSTGSQDESIRFRIMMRRGQLPPAGLLELVAFEKQSGRRLWTAGGAPVEQRFGNELASSWFAGPPAVSGCDLYSVIEKDGAIQLACLSAETGALRWTTTLVYPEIPISQDPVRQLVAARILATGGLVYATTTTGWVCAVDQVTRTTLWARRLQMSPGGVPQLKAIGNTAFLAQKMLPLNAVWRSETPILAADTLLLFSSQSHQMTALNPVNGRLSLKSDSEHATVLLHADETILVVSSADVFTAWQIEGMKRLWTARRPHRDSVPVGRGVLCDADLLIPMSDGTILPLSIDDGQFGDALTGLRPAYSSGGLFAAEDDVLSYAPDHFARISSKPRVLQPGKDALKQAQFLAETGRLHEAIAVLLTTEENPLNAEEIRRLRFRIAVSLFVQESATPATASQDICSLAYSDQENAVSRFLVLDNAIREHAVESFEMLVETLELDDAVLAVEIPDRDVLLETLKSPASPLLSIDSATTDASRRRPLKSWVQQQLRLLISDADPDATASLLKSLDRLSDAVLLGLHAPALRNEYLRRAEIHLQSNTASETTLHLLLEVIELSKVAPLPTLGDVARADTADAENGKTVAANATVPTADSVFSLLERMSALLEKRAERDPSEAQMSHRLLEILRSELMTAALPGAPISATDPRDLISERWVEQSRRSYSIVPVSTVSQMPFRPGNDRPVTPGNLDDGFVTAFDWTLRRDPGILTARSLSGFTDAMWSLKTRAADNLVPQARDRLSRFGSVLMLQTSDSVSAFSAIDQRWLWSRRIPDRSLETRLSAVRARIFADFNSIQQAVYGPDRRIRGAGLRWICLHSGDSVEIVDLLTGEALWRISGVNPARPVIACSSAVCVMNIDARDQLLLNTFDGSSLHSSKSGDRNSNSSDEDSDYEISRVRNLAELQRDEAALDLLTGAIGGFSNSIVAWNPKTQDKGIKALDWIHPVTQKLVRRVELPGVQFAQFLDEKSLVGVTDDETMFVIDLHTGKRETLHFSKSEHSAVKALNPERVIVFADAAHYYVFETVGPGLPVLGFAPTPYALNSERVQAEIRAVDRKSKTLAWSAAVADGTHVCLDHSTEPILLLVQMSNPVGGQKAAPVIPNAGLFPTLQKCTITGLSRSTGTALFTWPVVARNLFPGLRIRTNRDESLDLDAFGNRVRLLPR